VSNVPLRLLALSTWGLLVAGGPGGGASLPTPPSASGLARPVPAPPVLVNGAEPIPANGALLIVRSPYASSNGPVTVTVVDSQGHALPGMTRDEGSYVVWTPSQPFEAGAVYPVTLFSDGVQSSTAITIAPARPVTRPVLMSRLSLRRIDVPVETQCCTSLQGFPPIQSGCVPTRTEGHVGLTVTLTASVPASELHQFLFRVTGVLASDMPVYRADLAVPELTFLIQSTQYCLRIEAMDLASGRLFNYDDLMPLCAAHGALGDLSNMAVAIDAKTAFDHASCQVPPAGYEAMWCSTNEALCSVNRSLSGCENFGHLCHGEAAPVPPAAGSGRGFAGSEGRLPVAGSTGTVGNGAAGAFMLVDMTRLDDTPARPAARGCAVIVPSARRGGLSVCFLMLSASLLAARRRRPPGHNADQLVGPARCSRTQARAVDRWPASR
jgi:hypothetical protein